MLLIKPMLAMMALTACVWLFMYIRRLSYMAIHHIPPAAGSTPEKMAQALPEQVNYSSNNLKNLFELPVIFYGLCLAAMLLNIQSPTFLGCAWLYVGLRTVHSAVQCTLNHIPLRFTAYILSSVVLWGMLAYMIMLVWVR